MAWIVFDLLGTLIEDDGMEGHMPTNGAVEALNQLMAEGHRLTIHSSLFAPMPDSERQRMKEDLESELQNLGFPPIEVWTGTTKPDADLFIGSKDITYQNDWGLALAQAQVMMEDMGIVPGPQPDMGEDSMMDQPEPGVTPDAGGEQMPEPPEEGM